ncbi:MAG: CorA family divalent cation transporter [Pseudomonadota bacterium]
MALHVLDIAADGTANEAADTALSGPGAWRWWHFDRADPALPDWAAAHLPAIPAQALLMPETRPRCDAYGEGLMLNLRGVNLNADGPEDQMVAVRLWIAPQAVVSVRVRRVFAIDDILNRSLAGDAPRTPMAFTHALAQSLTDRIQSTVFDLAAEVDTLEDTLDDGGAPPGTQLAGLRRKAIRLRRYLGPQREALSALSRQPMAEDYTNQVRELANIATLTVEEVEGAANRLTAIHDHHAGRAAEAHSRNGYALSVVAAVFLPLGFATGLFGVNVAGMPGMENPAAFWLLSAAMVGLAIGALALLRWLRWI